MAEYTVVFESPGKWDAPVIYKYIRQRIPILIIEPFHTYHHRKGIFFPPHLPSFVEALIRDGKVSLLKADEIKAKEIYFLSADKAVEVIESVFPEHRKEHKEFFEYVSETLKSPVAEDVFKKNLCYRLAEFYSVNTMLHRIDKLLAPGPILLYPEMNVRSYLYLKELLSKTNQGGFEHPNIRFPIQKDVAAFFEDSKECLMSLAKLAVQTIACGLLGGFRPVQKKKKKRYSCGITIVSPTRQLADNRRGPDFMIDNNKILPEDVVYFPLIGLTDEQKKRLAKAPGEVFYPPKSGRFFSHFAEWKKLLWLAFKKSFLRNGEEIKGACGAFSNYFRWQKVMESVSIRHFITYCDFGIGHIGRNLALHQAGVQTWYFTDSANSGYNWREEKGNNGMRHPFWTYLCYDHFVTWNEVLAQYYRDHPGSFKQTHVVGCLWSGHIQKKTEARKLTSNPALKNLQNRFVLAVFDTTYTMNGITPYAEGLAFAEHIIKLADTYPEIYIFLKEKHDRNIHHIFDCQLGPKLLDLYKKMDDHPRITTFSDQADASELISVSDMVVSFPFTSTTLETLSVNRPAIWHDPMGYYRDTLYGRVEGVTTHGYDELKAKVLEIKNMKAGTYQNPIPVGSPLMDPYCDGKAIARFRELLSAH